MRDKISALMDGELDSIDVADTITRIKEIEELRNEWSTYHLIGDALRQSETSIFDMASGIRNELDIEPIVLTPDIPKEKKGQVFVFAIAASMVAAVAAVTWMGGQTMDQTLTDKPALQAVINNKFVEPTVVTDLVLAQEDELKTDKLVLQESAPNRLNNYMFAHEEFFPRTSIRGMSPYMRTVAVPYK